jgi:Putative beta-barrel porin-2, OmpL-like. bbp2
MQKVKRFGWVMMAGLALALLPHTVCAASADEPTLRERVDKLEKEVKDTLASKLPFDTHALLAVDYIYNFNSPKDRTNTFRVFDTDSNSASVNEASLFLSRQREDESLGFVLNVDYGDVSIASGSSDVVVREAYLTYKLPFVEGVTLKAGRFVTLLGYEILKTWDNFNPSISRSILFGYAIPFEHVGGLINIPIGDMISIDAGVVNGWDNGTDNNDGKTFLGGVGINPIDMLSMYFAGTYGPEQDGNGHSKRGALTAVFTVKATDALTFVTEADYANETDLVGPNMQDSALWYGVAGYVIFKATDDLSFAFRAEGFDDSDGVRLNSPQAPNGSTTWEVTPTVAYQLTNGLLWRAEYRHDESDKHIFNTSSDNFVRGQDTIATELIYAF